MSAPSPQPDIDELARKALRREVEQRLAAGDKLVAGEWLEPSAARRARRRRAWLALRDSLEALMLWAVVTLFGLFCLLLVTEII
jgi:hypothetical protein